MLAHVNWAWMGFLHPFHMEAPNKTFHLFALLLIPALNQHNSYPPPHCIQLFFYLYHPPTLNQYPTPLCFFFPQHMLQAAWDLCSVSAGKRVRSSQISDNWHVASTFLDTPCQHCHAILHCPLKGKQLCTASKDLLLQSSWYPDYITLMLGNFRLR